MAGGRTALAIGFFAAVISIVIGTLYGAISGLSGRLLDGVMMRFVDIVYSIPFLFIVLVLATKFSATVLEESLLLGFFSWLVPARLMRGEVLSLRERDSVWAARVMGASRTRLVYKHLIPNSLSVVIVNVTFLVADSILALAFLGFLGFGLQYPTASWGDMLGNADTYVSNGQWWLVYPVGACLVAVVMACNLVGDGLRDAFDVRLRRRHHDDGVSGDASQRARGQQPQHTHQAVALDRPGRGERRPGDRRRRDARSGGESGCGKSMLGLSIMGLLPRGGEIIEGSVRLDGQDLVGLPESGCASSGATRWR